MVRLKEFLIIPLKNAFSEDVSQTLQMMAIFAVGMVILGGLVAFAFGTVQAAGWTA